MIEVYYFCCHSDRSEESPDCDKLILTGLINTYNSKLKARCFNSL